MTYMGGVDGECTFVHFRAGALEPTGALHIHELTREQVEKAFGVRAPAERIVGVRRTWTNNQPFVIGGSDDD